jgi:hypothetical protein
VDRAIVAIPCGILVRAFTSADELARDAANALRLPGLGLELASPTLVAAGLGGLVEREILAGRARCARGTCMSSRAVAAPV